MELVVTATQGKLTRQQLSAASFVIASTEFDVHRNGGCVGGDEILAQIVVIKHPRPSIILHRGNTPEKWSTVVEQLATVILDPEDNLKRNRTMCDLALKAQGGGMLLACPGQEYEVQRSGTWATIRYAKKIKLTTIIIYPSGKREIWI